LCIVYVYIISYLLLLPGAHPFAGTTGKVNISKVVKGDRSDLGGREYSHELKALIYTMVEVV
jgi:hypothetical protein